MSTTTVSLTDRQREIMDLVAAGKTDFEISDQLGIGPVQIRRQISRAMEVNGANHRTHLAVLIERSRS